LEDDFLLTFTDLYFIIGYLNKLLPYAVGNIMLDIKAYHYLRPLWTGFKRINVAGNGALH
jgi:hypothetical protein